MPGYVAIELDEQSKRDLLRRVPAKHPVLFGSHLTLALASEMLPGKVYPLGQQVSLVVQGVCSDELGQAVVVDSRSVETFLAPGRIPHVTISCAEGVKPKYSKELVAKGSLPVSPFILTGCITEVR